jgi:hypothetical protein
MSAPVGTPPLVPEDTVTDVVVEVVVDPPVHEGVVVMGVEVLEWDERGEGVE